MRATRDSRPSALVQPLGRYAYKQTEARASRSLLFPTRNNSALDSRPVRSITSRAA